MAKVMQYFFAYRVNSISFSSKCQIILRFHHGLLAKVTEKYVEPTIDAVAEMEVEKIGEVTTRVHLHYFVATKFKQSQIVMNLIG